MLLTVEYDASKGVVEIHVDEEGADFLIGRLSKRKQFGGHDHLKTPSWGGWELTEDRQGLDNDPIHHLSIRYWPRETVRSSRS